jgi:general nucleoside transport system permease protein
MRDTRALLRSTGFQLGAVAVGLVLSTLVLAAIGQSPPHALRTLLEGAFGSEFALRQTALKAVPLALAGLAVTLPLRMNLWNIGGEGQLYAGAIGATWVALTFGGWSAGALLPAMVIASIVAGAVWALLAAVPRAFVGVNEIITTLLLNFVAILAVAYLVTGPWRSTAATSLNFPVTNLFPEAAILPHLGRIHVGVFFPLAVAGVLVFLLQRSRWGYEVRMIGSSPVTAKVVGIPIARNILVVMLVGGAIAGVAGMIEVSTTFGRLRQGISPGYGFMGIAIAALAGTSLIWTIVVAFLFGGFVVGGLALQAEGVPQAFVLLVQGIILFCALAGTRLAHVRISTLRPRRLQLRAEPTEESPSP